MDFRFLAAGILAAALGFVSGSTVFADAPRRAADPALAQAADERGRGRGRGRARSLPAAAELPALPKLPATPKMPDVNAILNGRRRCAWWSSVARGRRRRGTAAAQRTPTHKQEHEHEQEHESSDHERGDD